MAIVLANSNEAVTTSGTTLSALINTPSVPERYMVAVVVARTTVATTSVVYGADSLTLLGSLSHASQQLRIEFWGRLAPTAQNANVQATFPSGAARGLFVTIYTGVNQTTPYTGYPAAPTNFTSDQGNAITGTATNTLAVTTVLNDLVVNALCSDLNATGNWASAASAGMREYLNRIAASLATHSRGAVATKVAEGTSASVSWNFFSAGIVPQTGRSYVQAGFPLRPSTSIAPRAIELASTRMATAQNLNISPLLVQETTGFAATNAGISVATLHQGTTVSTQFTYASLSSTSLIGTLGGSGSKAIGSRVSQLSSKYVTPAAATNSVYIANSSYLAENDVIILSVYSEGTVIPTTPAGFTLVTSVVAANSLSRQDVYWKRLTAPDLNTTVTVTLGGTYISCVTYAFYRGCVTSGSPIGTGSAAPTTNAPVATSATPMALGLTTTVADSVVVALYGCQGASHSYSLAQSVERVDYKNGFLGDLAVLTPAATGDISVTTTSSIYTAVMLALIPASGGATYNPALTAGPYWAASRAVLSSSTVYNRTITAGPYWATSRAVLTRANDIYNRTLTAAPYWAVGRAVLTRTIVYSRTLTAGPYWAVGRAVLTRANDTYSRTIVAGPYWTTGRASVAGVITSLTVYNRTLTAGPYWAASRAVLTRANDTYNRTITAGPYWAASRAVLTRANDTYNRTLTAGPYWAVSRAVLTRANDIYNRTLVAGPYWATSRASVAGIIQSVSSGLVFGTYPVLWLYTAATYVNCAIYFEAQLFSGDGAAVGAHLNDVTGISNPAATGVGTIVATSQVVTTAPHTTFQRKRSPNLASVLVDGHVYRADMNRLTSPVPMTMVTALIAVEEN